jgi:hypothetical protein
MAFRSAIEASSTLEGITCLMAMWDMRSARIPIGSGWSEMEADENQMVEKVRIEAKVPESPVLKCWECARTNAKVK